MLNKEQELSDAELIAERFGQAVIKVISLMPINKQYSVLKKISYIIYGEILSRDKINQAKTIVNNKLRNPFEKDINP